MDTAKSESVKKSVSAGHTCAAKFSIKMFYFIYFTVSFVSKRDKYEIVTETLPFKNT